ncbi:hypothetical protein [Nakamurella endophytica]|uniref:Uncharacterized protein n=1 Tax=Nakamurella endophytica TaxID=1748367 RepID=A0A917WC74_9ACTN|nr:hypothetical protein [Nakamurella endophytica]GGL90660.1 hypothetical protein GCM10011594_07860 [Nakamurella endophytica]
MTARPSAAGGPTPAPVRVPGRLGARAGMLTAALAAMVASIGLAWRNSSLEFAPASAWVPGYCHVTYDGYSYCDTGYVAFGIGTRVGGPVAGTSLQIRVMVVVAAALLLWAARSRRTAAARAGVVVGVLGLFVGGVSVTSGRLLYAVGLAVAATVLYRAGLLARPGRTRAPRYPATT